MKNQGHLLEEMEIQIGQNDSERTDSHMRLLIVGILWIMICFKLVLLVFKVRGAARHDNRRKCRNNICFSKFELLSALGAHTKPK